MKHLLIVISFATLLYISACTNQENNQEIEAEKIEQNNQNIAEYLVRGNELATAVQATLGSKLKAAMQDGGVEKAIPLCQTVAIPIVDSFSQKYNAIVRRTALKVRNPVDKASSAELKFLKEYEAKIAAGQVAEPGVIIQNDIAHYFAPIIIQPLCLNCHGDIANDIGNENYTLIKNHYPDDEATGYKLGELRGMWSINFPVKN